MSRFRQILLLSTLTLSAAALHAQTGTISGTITDATGAAIPDATVTARNLGTSAVRTATTDASGIYSIPNVPVGRYDVNVEKNGFATLRFPNMELTVAQALTINGALQVGAVAQEVDVNASATPTLDLETAQISNVVDQKRITDLPLLTRDPYSLVGLSAGVVSGSNTQYGGFSVNGQRERNNNFLLDGVDNNDAEVPGGASGFIGIDPDNTQEFRVITNNFLPEYGRNTGAVVDVVTRGGTNDFHGSLYEFNRVRAMAARDFFNPSPQPQNPFVRNDFGDSIGGPIWKNHTFFFANTEWTRWRTTLTDESIVPSAAFKTGVFTWQGTPINLTSPGSVNNAQGLSISPTMQKLFNQYPNPNGPAIDDIRGIYFFPSTSATDTASASMRIDQHFSDKYNAFIRYIYNGYNDPDPTHDEFLPGLGATGQNDQTHSGAFNFTAAFRPTLLNEFRLGLNQTQALFYCGAYKTIDQFGTPDAFGFGSDYAFEQAYAGAPTISDFTCGLGGSNGQFRKAGTWEYVDNLSWVHGAHSFKFGAEYRDVFDNGYDAFGSRPVLSFADYQDLGVPVVNVGGVCNPGTGANCGNATLQTLSAALLGLVDLQTQSQYYNAQGQRTAVDYRHFRQHEYAEFAQDVWKIRPNLTLSIGLRYQFDGVPYETNGNLSNLYTNPSAAASSFTFLTAGPGTGRNLFNNDPNNWEPRAGLAWDPFKDGKTSVRLGYGIFHDRVFGNLPADLTGNPPFVASVFNILGAPLATVPPPATQAAPSAVVPDGSELSGITLIDPNLKIPYVQSWNVGVQREIPGGMTLEVNYVGSSSHRLFRSVDGNPPQPAKVAAYLAQGVPPEALQFGALRFGPLQATNNDAFIEPILFKSIGNANYNALQTTLSKRLKHGIQFQAAYTWSHSINDAGDPLEAYADIRNVPRNSLDIAEERGNSELDQRHRLSINYIFELPFGPGRKYLTNGLAGRILGGWEIAGISTFEAGHPYEVFSTTDSEHTGVSARADLIVPDPVIPPGSDETRTGPPASDFGQPAFGRPGNVGRDAFTGPPYLNTDVDLIKRFHITERFNVQFRAEAYNVFNQIQFVQPGLSAPGASGDVISDPGTFGISSATLTRPDGTTSARQLQLALKLEF